PRRRASGWASIVFGSITLSTNQADEQSAKRSSSVAEKTVRSDIHERTAGLVSLVSLSKAVSARSSRRDQPFVVATALAASRSSTAIRASARSRSRSLGAVSRVQVRLDSERRRVARSTSSGAKSARRSAQNGLGSRG